MDCYFSGVRSRREVDWLLDAGVERIMVDPFLDIDLVEEMIERWEEAGLSLELALDTGAYRIWQEGISYSDEQYLDFLRRHGDRFVLSMSLDSIGNHIMSYHNYVQILAHGFDVAPVWHWGSPKTYLHEYLNMSPVVAIGKLVPPMREQDTTMLRKLRRLCEEHPNRFHLLGLCWPKAIDALHRDGTVYSADSSEWLVGARRGLVLFPPCGDAERSIPATNDSPARRTKCSRSRETGTGASDASARPGTCTPFSRGRDRKTPKTNGNRIGGSNTMDRVNPHNALDRFFVLGRFYDPDDAGLTVWHAHDDTGALFARASEAYTPNWLADGDIKTFVYEGRRWLCTGRLLEPEQSDRPHQAGCRKVIPRAAYTGYDGSVPPWTTDVIGGEVHHPDHGLTGRIVTWNGEELVITNHYLVITSPLLHPQQGRLAGF